MKVKVKNETARKSRSAAPVQLQDEPRNQRPPGYILLATHAAGSLDPPEAHPGDHVGRLQTEGITENNLLIRIRVRLEIIPLKLCLRPYCWVLKKLRLI